MKIYSWNVNGIRAVLKKGDWQRFLASEDPDIVCLQETKADPSQVDIDLGDYFAFWHSASKKGYSGTAIFSKVEPLSVIEGFGAEIAKLFPLQDEYGDTTTEGRVLTLEFEHYFLSTVYTPNAKDDLSRVKMRQAWDPAYLMFIKSLEAQKPVIFCGDLNVAHTELDLARPKENKGKKGFTVEERAGFSAYLEAGLVDSFRLFNKDGGHYTWWSHFAQARARNIGWRIDYVLVSPELVPLVKKAKIHSDIMGSDHCPVSIEVTDLE